MGPKTSLDDVERRKILPLPGLELRSLGSPSRSQLLYRLPYPGVHLQYKNAFFQYSVVLEFLRGQLRRHIKFSTS
jgi:hypothetical protein